MPKKGKLAACRKILWEIEWEDGKCNKGKPKGGVLFFFPNRTARPVRKPDKEEK